MVEYALLVVLLAIVAIIANEWEDKVVPDEVHDTFIDIGDGLDPAVATASLSAEDTTVSTTVSTTTYLCDDADRLVVSLAWAIYSSLPDELKAYVADMPVCAE